MNRQQTARIRKMESYLDEASVLIRELSAALDRYEEIEDKYYKLEDYYGSTRWMADHEADEAGRLPDDLKRGVLSEDAVYDLLIEHRELMTRLQRAVLRCMEEKEF